MRASEIFNWLRKLDSGNPLSQLCDVYTYTTIIAQVLTPCVHCRSPASLLLSRHIPVEECQPVRPTKRYQFNHHRQSRIDMPRAGLSMRPSARLCSLQPGGVHRSAPPCLMSCCGRLQCGTGPGLQTAMELAKEMGVRRITMNCHAYSALMNGAKVPELPDPARRGVPGVPRMTHHTTHTGLCLLAP